MSKRIKYPNGVIYIEGKLSSHEEDEFYRQMTPKRILHARKLRSDHESSHSTKNTSSSILKNDS